MRSDLKRKATIDALNRGDSIIDRTTAMRKDTVEKVARHFVCRNEKFGDACQARFAVVAAYQAVGRASEVGRMNLENMKWISEDSCLSVNWDERKTGRATELPFFPHRSSYYVDFYHALGCHLLTNQHQMRTLDVDGTKSTYLFPDSSWRTDGGAARRIREVLKPLIDVVEELTDQHGSHSLRAGAADDMVLHGDVGVPSMVARGNWYWEGECQVFGYLTKNYHVYVGG